MGPDKSCRIQEQGRPQGGNVCRRQEAALQEEREDFMGKKKTGAMPTSAPKQKKKMVIDMTKVELAKAYQTPGFRTGKHMTVKDRPRKKDWKREYEKEYGKGSGRFHGGSGYDDRTGSFFIESFAGALQKSCREFAEGLPEAAWITITRDCNFFDKISRKILENNTGNR